MWRRKEWGKSAKRTRCRQRKENRFQRGKFDCVSTGNAIKRYMDDEMLRAWRDSRLSEKRPPERNSRACSRERKKERGLVSAYIIDEKEKYENKECKLIKENDRWRIDARVYFGDGVPTIATGDGSRPRRAPRPSSMIGRPRLLGNTAKPRTSRGQRKSIVLEKMSPHYPREKRKPR